MAKTVIDELIVRLGLDPSGFTKGQKKAVDALKKTQQQAGETDKTIRTGHAKTTRAMRDTGQVAARVAKGLEAHGKQGAEFFDQITRSGLKLLGIITAGRAFADFARDTIVTAAAQGRLAGNLGVSTKALTQWGAAVKQYAGGSASAAEGSMGGLLQSYQVFKATGKPDQRMMVLSRYLGLPITDLRPGKFSTLIGDLAAKMHAMPKPEAYAVGHMLGFDEGSINLLEQGRKAVDAHFQAVAKEGTVTGKQAKAFQKLQTAMIGAETASEALGRTLLYSLAPAMTAAAKAVTDVLEGDWSKLNKDLAPPTAKTATGAFQRYLLGSKQQTARRNEAVRYFMSQGLTRWQAAGLTANIQAESSYTSEPRVNPQNPHYGIAQWSETRRKQILAATGIDVAHATYRKQLEAMWWELHHTQRNALDRLKKTQNAKQAGAVISNLYERPGGYNAARDRGNIASGIYGATASSAAPRTLPPSVTSVLHALRAAQAHTVNHTVNHNQSETHIGAINVQTGATDGHGVVKAIQGAARNRGLAVQANGGLS